MIPAPPTRARLFSPTSKGGALADLDWEKARYAAFAVSPDGAYGWSGWHKTVDRAKTEALSWRSREMSVGNLKCKIHSVDGTQVLTGATQFEAARQQYTLGSPSSAQAFFDLADLAYERPEGGWDTGYNDTEMPDIAPAKAPVDEDMTNALIGKSIVLDRNGLYFASRDLMYRGLNTPKGTKYLQTDTWYVTRGGLLCFGPEWDNDDMQVNNGICRGIDDIRNGDIRMTYNGHTWETGVVVEGDAHMDTVK